MSEIVSTTTAQAYEAFIPLLNANFKAVMSSEQCFSPFHAVPMIEQTRDICATISLTGPVSIMLVLALDHNLAWKLMQHEVQALGLEENEEMLEAVLGEMINIIGGNATAHLAVDGQHIHLSLPMVLQAAKLKPAGKVSIYQSSLITTNGVADAYYVSPAILSFA